MIFGGPIATSPALRIGEPEEVLDLDGRRSVLSGDERQRIERWLQSQE